MAKSIRSKRRRKMRAIKRERYGVKELERLKQTVANDPVKKEKIDEVMEDLAEVVTVKTKKNIKENPKKADETVEKMDDDTKKHVYSNKTFQDQFGSYPVWLHQRRQKKAKKSNKKMKSKQKS